MKRKASMRFTYIHCLLFLGSVEDSVGEDLMQQFEEMKLAYTYPEDCA